MDKLGYDLDKQSETTFRMANGRVVKSIGKINKVQLFLDEEPFMTDFEVIDSEDSIVLLGNDWLKSLKANMDYEEDIVTVKKGQQIYEIPTECMIENYDNEDWSDGED